MKNCRPISCFYLGICKKSGRPSPTPPPASRPEAAGPPHPGTSKLPFALLLSPTMPTPQCMPTMPPAYA